MRRRILKCPKRNLWVDLVIRIEAGRGDDAKRRDQGGLEDHHDMLIS